jgi:hypothetical protein
MLNATSEMISQGLDPEDGRPLTPGAELPDGQAYETTDMPTLTVGGAPLGDPVSQS